MTRSDAQKRADKKYRKSLKRWYVDLKESDFEEIEKFRKDRNLTRKALLKESLKNNEKKFYNDFTI